jgi:N-acetylmuramoyl-L-alanine amidase
MSGVAIEDAHLVFPHRRARMRAGAVKLVVVHHSANANPAWGVRECHDCHISENGWNGIGYNYFIEQSGRVFCGRSDADRDYVGAHVAGINSRSLGVCLDGDYSLQIPTVANVEVLARVVAMLLLRHRLTASAIRYHNELAEKDCPGMNFPTRPVFSQVVRRFL